MRNYSFPIAAVLVVLVVGASQAAEKPRPAQGNQNQPKKIWTNEDMDQLRARGLISIVGQEVTVVTTQAPATPAEANPPVYASRLDDPEWYSETAADLQAEMDKRQAALLQQQIAIAQSTNRITQAGIALDKDGPGMTLAEGLANLQAQVQEVQNQLDDLADLAREHDIPPGVLRG
jgi:hypothetical protein